MAPSFLSYISIMLYTSNKGSLGKLVMAPSFLSYISIMLCSSNKESLAKTGCTMSLRPWLRECLFLYIFGAFCILELSEFPYLLSSAKNPPGCLAIIRIEDLSCGR